MKRGRKKMKASLSREEQHNMKRKKKMKASLSREEQHNRRRSSAQKQEMKCTVRK